MTPDALALIHAAAMVDTPAWSAISFSDTLDMPGTFLIAEGTQAFALGRCTADEAELLTLAVHPKAQRKGLGTQCLKQFETTATSLGATRAFLEVAATNTAAIALYTGLNWHQDGVRRAYYTATPARIDAILMSKPLKSHGS